MYIFHFYQLLNAAMINHTCKKSPQLILRAFLVFVVIKSKTYTNYFYEILYDLLNIKRTIERLMCIKTSIP